jgi:hypothetical protein
MAKGQGSESKQMPNGSEEGLAFVGSKESRPTGLQRFNGPSSPRPVFDRTGINDLTRRSEAESVNIRARRG